MTKTTRRYREKTIKLLFGSCGNQCAGPDCTNPIIAAGTPYSDAAVVGQICHIYAASDDGPRGKPGMTEEERNAPENLILMCGFHHPLVDKQWETYPADMLKVWKAAHESKYQPETAEASKLLAAMQKLAFVQTYSDQQINAEIERIRKARFLAGFPVKDAAMALATRVDTTELSGGSSEVRAKALAWCARLLSQGETAACAEQLLAKAKTLHAGEETALAEAFIVAASDKDRGLSILAGRNAPAARSAALRIVTIHDKEQAATAWMKNAGLRLDDFDSDGKLLHLMNLLSVRAWQDAIDVAEQITRQDFENAPVLDHAVGMACLIQAVPEEYRATVLTQVPFEVDSFPLASEEYTLAARRRAAIHFARVSAFAQSMGTAAASNPASDYVLWLHLRDPRDHWQGMDELRASMRNSAQSLRRLNYALLFGIKLDLASIEREIDQRVALSGKGTADEAFARFSLAFAHGRPQGAADYIAKHRIQLYEHLQKSSIQTLEVELLARAGSIGTATEILDRAVEEGLDPRQEQHLRRIIAKAEGADPALQQKKLYAQTGDLRALANLVRFLEDQETWQELLPYADELFARTRSLEDGARVAGVLNTSAQYGKLFEFLSSHQDLVDQNIGLKTLWAWSLYREGRFADASAVLKFIAAARDDLNDRTLRVGIAIASGNWEDLVAHTKSEWEHRDQRSAAELLSTGQLAHAAGAPHAADLVKVAAARGPNDPAILAGAYMQATNAGWEQNPTTSQWLIRAAELSGEDGPMRMMSIQELVDRKPEWDKQESSVWEQLNAGALPAFGAAQMLNRSLFDLVLLPSLANLAEADARRRSTVYAFSGARSPMALEAAHGVALDVAAIITLARLGLLETVIASYAKVVIPHATMGWLFQERQRATFHQPSRIKNARDLKQLVATHGLRVLPTQPIRDHTLAMEIGIDIAGLLTAARAKSATGDGVPRYVVRSAPIHRIGSLMAEEADVSAYADVLCSCQAVVAKLASKALLVASEEEHGRSFLKLRERVWPFEPLIADGAELYLDDLSVTYLDTVGVLDKLKSADLTAYITENDDSDANRLIAVDNLTDRQLEVIESIRRILAGGLQSGKVKAVRSQEPDQQGSIRMHPTFGVLGIGEAVDAFVVDDRFINRHVHMTRDSQQTPILCSLDILDDLQHRGAISIEHLFAHRTHLRRAGFQLIPVTEDELLHHLARATISEDALVETAELRAIRESFLRVRMSKMLQIPLEVPWLQRSTNAIIKAVKRLWQIHSETKDAAVRAQWLVDQLDLRGFAASAVPGNESTFAQYAQASQILLLLTAPLDVPASVRDTYFVWIDESILEDIKTGQPEVFAWLVERARELIAHSFAALDPGAGGIMSKEAYVRASLAVLAIELFPKLIRDALISDDGFRAEYGLATDAVVTFGNSGVSFQRSLLSEAVKQAFNPAIPGPTVEDAAGQSWQVDVLSGDTPTIAVAWGEQRFLLAHLAMLSSDRDTRLRVFRHEADRLNLPLPARTRWEELLTAFVPDDYALSRIQEDLNDTPAAVQETIQNNLSSGSISEDVLVPRSLSYYERLIGPFAEGQTFEGLAKAVARHMKSLVDWRAFEGYQYALLLAAQPALGAGLNKLAVSPDQLTNIYDWLIAHGDVMSRAAAIETGLGLIQGTSELRAPLRRLIEAATSSDQITAQVDAFELLSALTILTYGELAYTRVLASRPPIGGGWPPWRRPL